MRGARGVRVERADAQRDILEDFRNHGFTPPWSVSLVDGVELAFESSGAAAFRLEPAARPVELAGQVPDLGSQRFGLRVGLRLGQ
ncbi:hypothetical protein [Bifidobacterium scaligerum]|uniref:Uncharacterized protein n=1 Tax=Bifidobacterium scaligerum TaxID=2052656 RepID=A0A2M9HQF7_9BIFI|nr:hypothetical protein [Bifidobacterium scaligerum]PJM79021.1 hypothetical protein CUU80_06695 [Bifidobacterium scaligerum]